MGHSHSHNHSESTENIKVAFALNLLFSIIEIIGGLFTNSIAILSDALHDLGDSMSLALSWHFQKVSLKKSDLKYSYGYRRFSLLGALINSVILLVGSFFVITESVKRLANPEQSNAEGMLLLAIIGIAVNGIAMIRLNLGHSLNERTVSLHLLEDVLGWVAVLIGSLLMMFIDLPIIDPMLSLGIACYILFNIYHNLRDVRRVILQGTPENISKEDVKSALITIEGVENAHDLHLWTMDGEYNIMSAHLVINSNNHDISSIKRSAREKMQEIGIHHSTLEIEQDKEECEYADGCGN